MERLYSRINETKQCELELLASCLDLQTSY